MKQPELILFAKQPLAGAVKTRLQPEYSAEQAAEIASFLIRASVELAVSAWPGAVYLSAWPSADHPLFHGLAREFSIQLADQAAGDLGAKMWHALRQGIQRAGCAAILGCDVPHAGWDTIDQANTWLARGRDVIGPTHDGGYYFIGLHEARPELFDGITWGSRQVLSATLAQAAKLGMEFEMLKKLRDVDSASDLWLIAQKYEALKRFLK